MKTLSLCLLAMTASTALAVSSQGRANGPKGVSPAGKAKHAALALIGVIPEPGSALVGAAALSLCLAKLAGRRRQRH